MHRNCIVFCLLAGFFLSSEAIGTASFETNKEITDISESIKADASEYVDQVLANLRSQMIKLGLDRVPLPDHTIGFEKEILGIIWHGEAGLYNGELRGLETVHRTGVADISIGENGEIFIATEIGVNQGAMKYSMKVQFMGLGPDATVDGELSKVRIATVFKVNKDLTVVLDKFDIKSTGVLKVDVKGLGIVLNFLAEIIAGAVGNLVKGIIVLLFEGTIKNLINEILKGILYPPESFMLIETAANAILGSYGV